MDDCEIGNLSHHYKPNSFRPEIDDLIEAGFIRSRSARRYRLGKICYHVPTNVFRVHNIVTDIPSMNHVKMMAWEISQLSAKGK